LLNFGIKVLQPTEKAYRQGDYEGGTRAFLRGILGADAYNVLPDARKEQMRENESTNVAQMLGAGFPLLTEAEIRGVTAPTLLVTGERSPVLFRRYLILQLADFLPNVRRVEIKEASHIMHEHCDQEN
jgi:pimeloyl-ACP methyl ester carboxylesterase